MSSTNAASAATLAPPPATGRILVERWPTERALFALALVVSLLLWIVALLSVAGLVYAAMLGAIFFVMHLAFVAHVRGSGVRIGPDQFPQLYARVESMALRMGMDRVPETYLLQAGGSLNAFATRFLGTQIVVLFSDLLEACGENQAARDMIIAHELGHLHAGHLRWHWFMIPARFVPFLGTALSRAREYTCDRYGLAGAGDRDGALHGLTILAAGGSHAPLVNRQALVRQHAELNTGWMTIGEWLSTHPPLVKRMLALDPSLRHAGHGSRAGVVRALLIVGVLSTPLLGMGGLAVSRLPGWLEEASQQAGSGPLTGVAAEQAAVKVRADFRRLSTFLAEEVEAGRALPEDTNELYERWQAAHPGAAAPIDPFDGQWYGYAREDAAFRLFSSGPDGSPGTDDDLNFTP